MTKKRPSAPPAPRTAPDATGAGPQAQKADQAAAELRELTRQAHEAAAELKAAQKAASAALARIPHAVEEAFENSFNEETRQLRTAVNSSFKNWQEQFEGAFKEFTRQFMGAQDHMPPWLESTIVSMVNRVSTQIISDELWKIAKELKEFKDDGTGDGVIRALAMAAAVYAQKNAELTAEGNAFASQPVKYIRFEQAKNTE